MVFAGIPLVFIGGFVLFGANLDTRNPFIALLPIVIIGTGIYGVITGLKIREQKLERVKSKAQKQAEINANVIEICVQKRDGKNYPRGIYFTSEPEDEKSHPVGTLMEVANWKRMYYVRSVYINEAGDDIENLEPLYLPDGEVLSPRLYIIPLLMQAYESFIIALRTNNRMATIRMGVMLAAFGITSFILFLTIGG